MQTVPVTMITTQLNRVTHPTVVTIITGIKKIPQGFYTHINKSNQRVHTSAKASIIFKKGSLINKWENLDLCYYLYPGSDPDHSQNLMGSKLNQDPSLNSFMKV